MRVAVARRSIVLGAAAAALPPLGRAAPRLPRVGALCAGDDSIRYLWQDLRELGYVEHRNVEYVFKGVDATGDVDGTARKLVAAEVDVIVACSNVEAMAAKRATSRTPIVLLYGAVPVETGLVDSLARPGGNVTGTAAISTDLAAKSVEVLKAAVPTLRRVAALVSLDDPVGRVLHAASERAAATLGLTLTTCAVGGAGGLDQAFEHARMSRAEGLLVSISVLDHFPRIVEFAARERLPAIYPVAPALRMGGLLTYSPDWLPQSKQNARTLDRLLKGAKPGDIPVEQPVGYLLGVNLKTARALSLPIPKALLLRATRVLE